MIAQYLDNVNADSFYNDDSGARWLITGDVAVIDAEGYAYVLGRSKDIIKRASVSISPAALENCLRPFAESEVCVKGMHCWLQLTLELQVAVVGVPDPIYETVPFAVLTSFGGKSAHDIEHHIVEMFGEDHALGGAVELDQLGFGAMPLDQNGKVQRLHLQEALKSHPELLPGPVSVH